ncbi:hypothetical protein GGX14DRAFT_565457 [Mycena pura]|uniref:F-box domain-containing protein n=1 Tax=Mycena pura TaxID=153505 RepID=A0AAD6YDP9_9AGAR|nr:hypothetical protein GGX14DRAFT_565457 [Mycena pura]
MSAFPPELEDLVIAHMQGDNDALASCALVSRSWLHISRPYLFGSVTLLDGTYEDFLRLKASPRCTFIPSIRTLSISRPQKGFSDMPFTKLITKLAGFPALTCLRVSYEHWIDLSPSSVATIVPVFHDITELDIQHSNFAAAQVIALIACLPRLEKVMIHFLADTRMHALPWLPVPPDPPDPPRNLQVVRLRQECTSGSPCIGILSRIAKAPLTVRVLGLGEISRKDLPAVGTHLRVLGPALCDLDLEFETHISASDIETDLAPHLACLTHITKLTAHIDVSDALYAGWYSPLTLLAALPSEPATLETLTIVLANYDLHLMDPELFDWGPLHAAARAHTRLRLLQFHVHTSYFSVDPVLAMKKIRKDVAPLFAATFSVEVEACDP